MMITMHPVKSSQIKSVGYDTLSQTLAIEFKNGSLYHYSKVPPEVYTKFAESIGRFFGTFIKPFPELYPFMKQSTK